MGRNDGYQWEVRGPGLIAAVEEIWPRADCLSDDVDALVVHLRHPLRHRERWRSTNLLERSLGEVRRRTKVMGRFRGETSCLSLVWAVLDLFFTHASNGATFTDVDRQHLYRINYQQADPGAIDEEVTAA
jgi:Transposase, Mutator family